MIRRSRLSRIVQRVHVEVETALWACLVAFVVFFCVFVAPEMPQQQAKAKLLRDREITEENSRYCAKWGKEIGTREHLLCTMDLQELRKSIAQRLAEETVF